MLYHPVCVLTIMLCLSMAFSARTLNAQEPIAVSTRSSASNPLSKDFLSLRWVLLLTLSKLTKQKLPRPLLRALRRLNQLRQHQRFRPLQVRSSHRLKLRQRLCMLFRSARA